MSRRQRLVLTVLGVFVLLLGALAWGVVQGIDSPHLGRLVLGRLGAAAGLELTAASFHLQPLSGLDIRGLQASGTTSAGQLEASADRLVLHHRLAPLLHGRLVLDEIRLVRPHMVLTPSGKGPAPTPTPTAAPAEPATPVPGEADSRWSLSLEVHEARIEDASLVARGTDPEAAPTEVDGLDLDLRDLALDPAAGSPLQGLTANGEITAAQVSAAGFAGRSLRGRIAVADGHGHLRDLSLDSDYGPFAVSDLDLNLAREPTSYRLAAQATPLDLSRLLAVEPGALGTAHLQVDAHGTGSDTGNLEAHGRLQVDAGKLPAAPLFTAIDGLLGGQGLVGSAYDAAQAGFDVGGGRLTLQPFELAAGELRLGIAGEISLDGALDLHLTLRGPRAVIRMHEIPHEVLDALTDPDGRVAVPIRVSGRAAAPRVAPDREELGRRGRRKAVETLEEKLTDRLQQLLGGHR